jgi:hypothetical protein
MHKDTNVDTVGVASFPHSIYSIVQIVATICFLADYLKV